jgi:RNA polymerase sigma-70 factor (ECF subfamily)
MHSPRETPPENWLDEYGDILYRYALARVHSEPTAEDLVQETLLAGLQAYDKFSGQSTLRTWLVGILKHKIIDHFRKNHHQSLSLSDSELGEDILAHQFDQQDHWKINLIEWSTPDEAINSSEFKYVLHECISRLPQKMADLLMLNTIEDVSTEACCKVLNFQSTNQLWVALSRTRMKLRSCLDTHWFNQE